MTRQEMIYEFMVALAANQSMTPDVLEPHAIAQMIRVQAENLADEVLRNL
jgi:hypothetical protein